MVILVTGYSGFVGGHTVPKLLNDGHELICYGRRKPPAAIGCQYVKGDLCEKEGFDEIPWGKIDAVLHLASAGVKASSRHTNECLRVNVRGLLNLLEALGKLAPQLQRFVYTPTFYEQAVDEHPELLKNPYISSKHIATQILTMWGREFSGQISLATLYQVYGPGDDSSNVLSYVISQLRQSKPAKLGSGLGLRDWIYIEDVTDALALLFSNPILPGVTRHDLGSGQLLTIREMCEKITMFSGLPYSYLEFDASRDRPDGGLAIKASSSLLNWNVKISVEEGLKKFILL